MSEKKAIEPAQAPVSNINLQGVFRIPAVRQTILLLGIAASVALGFAVVLWSQTPGYAHLYTGVDAADAAQIADALRSAGIRYKIDTDAGVVMVADSQLHDARLQLASQGLADVGSKGMDLLDDQSSFGVSQFMESARYQRALEGELAETISHLGAVRSARVHLAIPRQSAFVRDKDNEGASASVLLDLNQGKELEPDQAAAIVHLVASSIPNLSTSRVTLIDQFGRLLSAAGNQAAAAQASNQLRYTQQLEEKYTQRIVDMLTPVVGPGRVRAQVSANLDFTVTEETRESFDPAQTVVRSEQISEEEVRDSSLSAQGIPGALSNQPPEEVSPPDGANAAGATAEPTNRSRSSTRNYEVDRTISRVQPQPGKIQRLSVAVLVDAPEADGTEPADGADGAETGLTEADIAKITSLAKEAVGFDEARGDSFVLTRAAFRAPPDTPAAEEPGFLQSPMVIQIAKLVLGALVALGLGFGLVRPLFKGLLAPGAGVPYGPGGQPLLAASGAAAVGVQQYAIAGPSFEEKVAAAKNITSHDPARVAQIVRKWIADNG
jgi:flagellar M-ring protein FliF